MLKKDKNTIQAIAELLRDGVVLKTSYGYELKRFDSRLEDDIDFAA